MNSPATIRYVINAEDQIAFVDDAWNRFADANDGAGLEGANILGRSLWDFIADAPTLQLYQQIVARVRRGRLTRFTLRCDGPSCRRLLQMTISAKPDGAVEFQTQALRVEDRPAQPLLARTSTHSTDLLQACGWCNRIHVDSDHWVEVEDATERLQLFERDRMPQLTHGICETCLESMTDLMKTKAQP